jgi:uncharacterized protein YdeI (YjbR/CyaY-like superfamily)
MNPKVDFYFNKASKWQEQFAQLRTIILECGLSEELKWGEPCYTLDDRNIVLIHGFKEYCALLFFKGALLKDPHSVLVQQTENLQSARQMRFTDEQHISDLAEIIKALIADAIAVEKAGLKVELKKTIEFPMPEEFQIQLDQNPALKAAF